MQAGDKFIRYTKKGAIQGRVKSIVVKQKYDLRSQVKIEVRWILTETGESFEENGCYLVIEELTLRDAISFKKLLAKLRGL
jgi:hypothetical protein